LWYQDFSPVSDEQVRELLARSQGRSRSTGHRVDRAPGRDRGGATRPAKRRIHVRDSRTGSESPALAAVRRAARPLAGPAADHDPLIDFIASHRLIFIGEATHGTHEFYRERAEIS